MTNEHSHSAISNGESDVEHDITASKTQAPILDLIEDAFRRVFIRFSRHNDEPELPRPRKLDTELPKTKLLKPRIRIPSINEPDVDYDSCASKGSPRLSYSFRDKIQIPYVKRPSAIYLYPHAEMHIGQEHRDRYPQLVEVLKLTVEQHSRLAKDRNWLIGTAYTLAMCGADIDSAVPSVVVFCPDDNMNKVKYLQRTLNQKHIVAQYRNPTTPLFQVYVWARSFTLCGRTSDEVDIHIGQRTSLCGAAVTSPSSGERLCTVAAVLRIKDSQYALTSAHAFNRRREDPSTDPDFVDESDLDEDFGSDFGSNFGSDEESTPYEVEYDFPAQKDTSIPPLISCRIQEQDPVGKPIQSSIACRSGDLQANNDVEDLDFALLTLDDPTSWTNNSYQITYENRQNIVVSIDRNPSSLPTRPRHVRIIASASEPKVGLIHTVPSFIRNSLTSDHLCEVWVVSIISGSAPSIGHSGSLVVDIETCQPYGHVIAVSPLGQLYVVPLRNTFRQVQKTFDTSRVELYVHEPEPPIRQAYSSRRSNAGGPAISRIGVSSSSVSGSQENPVKGNTSSLFSRSRFLGKRHCKGR